MAIKTEVIKTIPGIDLDHIHFTQTNISISEKAPHRIAISAKVRPYGIHEGAQFYDKDYQNISINDVHAYIGGLVPADQLKAMQAMAKVQEGLGILAELKLGISFVNVE